MTYMSDDDEFDDLGDIHYVTVLAAELESFRHVARYLNHVYALACDPQLYWYTPTRRSSFEPPNCALPRCSCTELRCDLAAELYTPTGVAGHEANVEEARKAAMERRQAVMTELRTELAQQRSTFARRSQVPDNPPCACCFRICIDICV